MKQPKIIELVVNNNLCIGCGLCVAQCPSKALKMSWNDEGFLIPQLVSDCNLEGDCLQVCPFNPFPKDEVKTENEIANLFLSDSKNHHQKIGKYNSIYAGFSNQYRLSSSSGGLATYICAELLNKNIADHIISIKESDTTGTHYEYAISSSHSELLSASKTRYFPVTMANVFTEIDKLEGKVAVVGVGCFIKAIRLAQYNNPKLKEKISFLIGIICGGVKSRFFTEYLASKMSIESEDIKKPQFRVKDINSTANDYSFSCFGKNENEKSLKMKSVGDMWGTGLFKANACDFCDDVTTELADISLGDAWLHPYYLDGKGTNVVVTRSNLADKIINEGIENKNLIMNTLPVENFLASQQGSFNHRHNGLVERIKLAKKSGKLVPPKRYENNRISFDFKMVQKQRIKTRSKSLDTWKKNPDALSFDLEMQKSLDSLKFYTKMNHRIKFYKHRLNKLLRIVFGYSN